MKKSIIIYTTSKIIFLSGFLLAFDLISKYFFYNQRIASNLSFFDPVFNTGISRSIKINIIFVIIISILALILFIYLYSIKFIGIITSSLLISGTLGNLLDRIFLGGVRDFISIGIFPVFNLADVFLNIGIFLIILNELFMLKNKDKKII